MFADHEIVAPYRLEPVAVVEAPGPVVIDVYGEIEFLEALPARLFDRPLAERLREPLP